MSVFVALLRGINLGRRQVKMAELKDCLAGLGLTGLKTVVASGNVRFETQDETDLKRRIEAALEERFGFCIEVVLRSAAEIEAMLAGSPFDRLDPEADVARHVILFDAPLPEGLTLADAGSVAVLRIDPREIYLACYRKPNGRYTEDVELVGKELDAKIGKGHLATMRNWNTIEKALG